MALLLHKESGTWKDRTDALSFKSGGAWGKKPTWYKHDGQWHLLTKGQQGEVLGIVRTATGGGAGTWAWCDRNGNPVTLTPDYFAEHPIYSGIVDEEIDGQAMVKIPRFYVKHENLTTGPFAGKPVKFISSEKLDGYHCYPAFMDKGFEKDCFWFGKYEGSVSSGKLCSLANVTPSVSMTVGAMRNYGNARNVNGITGFSMQSIYHRAAIQMLILAELASPDVQTLIGVGNVNSSGIVKTNAPIQPVWRGIYGLWGNIWEVVDGLMTNSTRRITLLKNNGDGSYVNTEVVGLNPPSSNWNGWTSEVFSSFGNGFDFGDIFIPSAITSTAAGGTYADAEIGFNTNSYSMWGGIYNSGTQAGLFCVYGQYGSSTSYPNTGTRLVKV